MKKSEELGMRNWEWFAPVVKKVKNVRKSSFISLDLLYNYWQMVLLFVMKSL